MTKKNTIKKMKKNILLFIFSVLVMVYGNEAFAKVIEPSDSKVAPTSISLPKLVGTKWKSVVTEVDEIVDTIEFNHTEMISTWYSPIWGKCSDKKLFFIANEIPKSFSTNSVGNYPGPQGKYLVILNTKIQKMRVYEVDVCTSDTLKMHGISENSAILGKPGDLHYVRMK